MNIQLEPEELKKLIELAHLGEWLINAHHDSDYQDEFATLVMQRLLSAVTVEGIDQDVETKEHYMATAWTERLYEQYILDYDDHVFWDELTERLAQRDLARLRGSSIDDIDRDENVLELRPLEERYREELEEHGVERLEINDGF